MKTLLLILYSLIALITIIGLFQFCIFIQKTPPSLSEFKFFENVINMKDYVGTLYTLIVAFIIAFYIGFKIILDIDD